MNIEKVFRAFFAYYCETEKIKYLTIGPNPSCDRPGDPPGTPHTVPGNAMDITLRYKGDYAPLSMYNDLFSFMFKYWPYRAGIDNTEGNVHIHTDLGFIRPETQRLPFFFKEEDGKYTMEITSKDQIPSRGETV